MARSRELDGKNVREPPFKCKKLRSKEASRASGDGAYEISVADVCSHVWRVVPDHFERYIR